jgi:hypothetical protein
LDDILIRRGDSPGDRARAASGVGGEPTTKMLPAIAKGQDGRDYNGSRLAAHMARIGSYVLFCLRSRGQPASLAKGLPQPLTALRLSGNGSAPGPSEQRLRVVTGVLFSFTGSVGMFSSVAAAVRVRRSAGRIGGRRRSGRGFAVAAPGCRWWCSCPMGVRRGRGRARWAGVSDCGPFAAAVSCRAEQAAFPGWSRGLPFGGAPSRQLNWSLGVRLGIPFGGPHAFYGEPLRDRTGGCS